jgi:hypothetical protein
MRCWTSPLVATALASGSVARVAAGASDDLPRIYASKDNFLVDKVGRVRIFHGFNGASQMP